MLGYPLSLYILFFPSRSHNKGIKEPRVVLEPQGCRPLS